MQEAELGLARDNGVHVAEQPVQVEVEVLISPLLQARLHGHPGVRGLGANLGQGEIALGELGAAAVHPIEDVHHHVDGLVGAGDLFHVKLTVLDRLDLVQAVQVVHQFGGVVGARGDGRHGRADALLHEAGHIHPQGVALHLGGHVEAELLCLQVEVEAREGVRVAVEEPGGVAPDDAVEAGDALLAVQQELDHAGCQGPVSPRRGTQGLRGPHQQSTHGVALVEREHEASDLIPVPHIAALELGQGHVAAVDVVEDGGELHLTALDGCGHGCNMPGPSPGRRVLQHCHRCVQTIVPFD